MATEIYSNYKSPNIMKTHKERIIIVDVLRGFALFMIVIIHFVEHFDFMRRPEVNFLFSHELDTKVKDIVFMLVSGKAYSVFAVLFGLSFFIQMDNKAQKGIDYRARFLWRMTVLFLIGIVHSFFYRGDILHMYALLSLPLILLYKVNTKVLWVTIVLLALQIPMIFSLIQAFTEPGYKYISPIKAYWKEGGIAYSTGTFCEVIQYNFWKGRMSVWAWSYNNGRLYQLVALFLVGFILGHKGVFENLEKHKKNLVITLLVSAVCIAVLSYILKEFKEAELLRIQKRFILQIVKSYISLAATAGIIALVSLLYLTAKKLYIFKLFSAYGKMSLTNYVTQGVFGALFFYHFGLGMYRYIGFTWSVILGTIFFFTQAVICEKWQQYFYYGPLEWFWRCCTNLSFNVKMRR